MNGTHPVASPSLSEDWVTDMEDAAQPPISLSSSLDDVLSSADDDVLSLPDDDVSDDYSSDDDVPDNDVPSSSNDDYLSSLEDNVSDDAASGDNVQPSPANVVLAIDQEHMPPGLQSFLLPGEALFFRRRDASDAAPESDATPQPFCRASDDCSRCALDTFGGGALALIPLLIYYPLKKSGLPVIIPTISGIVLDILYSTHIIGVVIMMYRTAQVVRSMLGSTKTLTHVLDTLARLIVPVHYQTVRCIASLNPGYFLAAAQDKEWVQPISFSTILQRVDNGDVAFYASRLPDIFHEKWLKPFNELYQAYWQFHRAVLATTVYHALMESGQLSDDAENPPTAFDVDEVYEDLKKSLIMDLKVIE
ncbi:hypothetical protein OQA88_10141 [Cercophora sp. LCS_1]